STLPLFLSSMHLFLVLSLALMVAAEAQVGHPAQIDCFVKEIEDTEFTVKKCGMVGLQSKPSRRRIAEYPTCMVIKTPRGDMHTCLDVTAADLQQCSKHNCLQKSLTADVSTCCCTS
ncbi:hypothetical protein PMAYCL1PPCAC_27855, partial [Pristionchus mayeri]